MLIERAQRKSYLEASRCVATLSAIAQQVINGALIDVGAHFSRAVHLVSGVADAAVRSEEILAGTVRTNARILRAFVDI